LSLLDSALAAPECVITVMGPHAGENASVIFARKIADCRKVGRTFWVVKSPKARPEHVQAVCGAGTGWAIFVEPATAGGARPTTESKAAVEYPADGNLWRPLPEGLSPVTGHMDRMAAALVLAEITTDVDGALDLWSYTDRASAGRPLRFKLGLSTLCAVKGESGDHPDRMKSRYRRIVAVGRLVSPYGVWLRSLSNKGIERTAAR
jgi:hypothetical protein